MNQRTSGDHPDYSIIKIDQNTEKSSGDLKRFAVTLWSTTADMKNSNNDNNNKNAIIR